MTSCSCFSLFSLYERYCRCTFTSYGLSHQSIQIDSETTISFWSPTPKSQSINKPFLILLQGFGPNTIWQFQSQVKYFSSYFSLYVPDLLFFGNSTTTSSERSIVFQAISIGRLLEKLGIDRYSVLGTSYGGFVAYDMARLFGASVEKVVIASSDVDFKPRDFEKLLERAKVERIEDLMLPKTASQMRHLIEFSSIGAPPYVPVFMLNDFIKTVYSENLVEKKELLNALAFRTDDQARVSPLQQEVLIVWGEHDRIFLLEKAMELKEVLGHKARLEAIKNTAHSPHFENATQFNNIVINFLSAPPN